MKKFIKIKYFTAMEDQRSRVEPMKIKRDWMSDSPESFAYHCLPLNVANQYGWQVLSREDFSATWDGGESSSALTVSNEKVATSVFGSGVLTIHVDFLLVTSKGTSTYVRGIPNREKENLESLDAMIETDWLPFTFTYNFKFKKPGTVSFEKNEPLFCFFPVDRGYIEDFKITCSEINDDKELFKSFNQYSKSRSDFIASQVYGTRQKFYSNGTSPDGDKQDIENHLKTVRISNPKPE